MKKLLIVLPLTLALGWPSPARAEERQRREWVYLGVHLGGQYLDLDALSGGDAFDQLVSDLDADVTGGETGSPGTLQPRHYSAENGFVWGFYGGVNLGRYIRLGLRFTHSLMNVHGEPAQADEPVNFDLNLITALIELQIRIPLFRNILVPFAGIAGGYAFLDGAAQMPLGEPDSAFGISCLDLQGEIGLDINLGRWVSLGAAAHFSFIGFYYDGNGNSADAEATWGFATDYLARLTFRI